MEKIKRGIKVWATKLKEMWLSMVISCGVWTVLVYLWTKGVRGFLFGLLNFFTGALLSVDGENMLGGVIGRTLILMVFNTFISSLLIHKGPLKTRFAFAKADFKSGLQNLSEYVSSFSMFATKQKDIIFTGVLALGLSIIWNMFITGNGALVNTFSCVALFIILLEQFETKSGFFVAMVNLGARKLGYKNICGDAVLAFIEAFMAGCLLMPILAFFHLSDAAYIIGVIISVVGVAGLLWTKGAFKRFTAVFLLFLLLMPLTEVKAGGTEVPMTLKQGTFTRDKDNGTDEVFTTTLTEVTVNGEKRSDEVIELYPGDVCSFVVYTDDPEFVSMGITRQCPTCNTIFSHHRVIQLEEVLHIVCRQTNFSAKYVFENIRIDEESGTGELSGTFTSDYYLVKDEDGFYELCSSCDEEQYMALNANGGFITNNLAGVVTGEVIFDGVDLTLLKEKVNGEDKRFLMVRNPSPDLTMDVTWREIDKAHIQDDEKYYFGMGRLWQELLQGEGVDYYYPNMDQGVSNEGNPDYGYDKEPDYGMSEEEYAEMLERGESVPMNTAVAVVASVATAGVAATVMAPLTSVVESAAGMKKKKGQLVVNGDVDIPTVHYNDYEKLMIPVNIADGEDVVWAITAIAITPDDEKLVKAIAVPTSSSSAEIKLEIQRAPKETVMTYIEVTALGVELTGEHYFHETMVEVNIEP